MTVEPTQAAVETNEILTGVGAILDALQNLGGGAAGSRPPTQTLVMTGGAGLSTWVAAFSCVIVGIFGTSNVIVSKTGRTANATGMNGEGGGYIIETQTAGFATMIRVPIKAGEVISFQSAGAYVVEFIVERT